ncbi:hypothetical protein [Rhizobium ruizarguesonis]|uniref:Uncharacterized protein n=1 Tax=Rhizobium ruizarguesonis TaxID=2081791 RepID=A0AB38HSE4_9HYPH|nr:hypothetical protein [Rhizobium ruizarguesonis]MCB2399359.1 hypothetical protein [Rhizobium ruizarguesonis]TBC02915.1 hypothetical protein ELH40_35445 [Rhizobium ruizarguesonis]
MTTSEIENLKGALRARLRRDFVEVSSARDTSRKAHLEVFESKRGGRALGVEFDHADRINLWVVRLGMPRDLPSTIERVEKEPKGSRAWIDANGDGANSNLSGYKQFATKPLARLAVKTLGDAALVLDHLTR